MSFDMSIMASLTGPLDPGELCFTNEGKELLAEIRPWLEDDYTPDQLMAMTIEQEQEDLDHPVR